MIWLARDKRAASVVGGIVIALLSLVPILFGTLLLAYIVAPQLLGRTRVQEASTAAECICAARDRTREAPADGASS